MALGAGSGSDPRVPERMVSGLPAAPVTRAAPSAFAFCVTDAGAYHIDPERGRIEIPDSDDDVVREQRLWGIPAALCFMHRGDFPLHAAAVEVGEGAVILAAPAQHGKTTLALAFHKH